jgi:hypothetical protein
MFKKLACHNHQAQRLTTMPQFGLRVRVRREINFTFENERKEYREKMKVLRKQHLIEYWDTQT